MIRLAPSAAPLWRSPTAVQLGHEPGSIVLEPVESWHERLLHALVTGIPDELFDTIAREGGANPAQIELLRESLRPVLVRPRSPVSVTVSFGDEVAAADRAAVDHAFAAAGARLRASANPDSTGVVILVASRLVEPRRAASLVARDIPHLALELAGDQVTVGPLVVPGRTGCLACLHEHRRAQDAAWPVLAAQLLARPCSPTEPAAIAAACATAMRLISAPVTERTRSLTVLASTAEAAWRDHEPHPACWCRSPGRSATPGVHTVPTPGPTTSSACALPA